MPILNYTSKVGVSRTCHVIQKVLQRLGAEAVMFEYTRDGEIEAVSFRCSPQKPGGTEHHGARCPISFRLPSNVDGTLAAMTKDSECPGRLCTPEQAKRVAWRIIKDWIEAQAALVESHQAELAEVFLPYALVDARTTFYRRIQAEGFPALEHHAAGGSVE